MSDNTKIEWTDATANYVNGCDLVSPGCINCYAMRLAGTRLRDHPTRAGLTKMTKAGPVWTGEVRRNDRVLQEVLGWKKPRRIFWNAHGDLFHESVPEEWIDAAFAVMALTPHHTHQVLTKRPERMREYLTNSFCRDRVQTWCNIQGLSITGKRQSEAAAEEAEEFVALSTAQWPLPNVWLGTSVEDQARADERIPHLLATPAAVRFISAEPLLGPVDLTRIKEAGADECFSKPNVQSSLNCLTGHYWGEDYVNGQWEGWCDEHLQPSPGFGEPGYYPPINWVIVGGESGPGARPMHPDWARSLRDQCAAAGVPFHFKQWGAWLPAGQVATQTGPWNPLCGKALLTTKKNAGRLLDGIEHDGFPGGAA